MKENIDLKKLKDFLSSFNVKRNKYKKFLNENSINLEKYVEEYKINENYEILNKELDYIPYSNEQKSEIIKELNLFLNDFFKNLKESEDILFFNSNREYGVKAEIFDIQSLKYSCKKYNELKENNISDLKILLEKTKNIKKCFNYEPINLGDGLGGVFLTKPSTEYIFKDDPDLVDGPTDESIDNILKEIDNLAIWYDDILDNFSSIINDIDTQINNILYSLTHGKTQSGINKILKNLEEVKKYTSKIESSIREDVNSSIEKIKKEKKFQILNYINSLNDSQKYIFLKYEVSIKNNEGNELTYHEKLLFFKDIQKINTNLTLNDKIIEEYTLDLIQNFKNGNIEVKDFFDNLDGLSKSLTTTEDNPFSVFGMNVDQDIFTGLGSIYGLFGVAKNSFNFFTNFLRKKTNGKLDYRINTINNIFLKEIDNKFGTNLRGNNIEFSSIDELLRYYDINEKIKNNKQEYQYFKSLFEEKHFKVISSMSAVLGAINNNSGIDKLKGVINLYDNLNFKILNDKINNFYEFNQILNIKGINIFNDKISCKKFILSYFSKTLEEKYKNPIFIEALIENIDPSIFELDDIYSLLKNNNLTIQYNKKNNIIKNIFIKDELLNKFFNEKELYDNIINFTIKSKNETFLKIREDEFLIECKIIDIINKELFIELIKTNHLIDSSEIVDILGEDIFNVG